jgi:hypothetical protein
VKGVAAVGGQVYGEGVTRDQWSVRFGFKKIDGDWKIASSAASRREDTDVGS